MQNYSSPAFVLTVSGSDASGVAGMQADNRAVQSANAFPLNVISAVTLQTGDGVHSIDLAPPELVRMHMVALLNAYPVQVVKTGMLGNAAIVEVLAETLGRYPGLQLVLDPILTASSGRPLLDGAGVVSLVQLLLPICFLVTPNLLELATLSGLTEIDGDEEELSAANLLLETGCKAVLVKGGHRIEGPCLDRLFQKEKVTEFTSDRVTTQNNRGTGCALASLIAGGLANGLGLENSIEAGKRLLTCSLEGQAGTKWPASGPAFI